MTTATKTERVMTAGEVPAPFTDPAYIYQLKLDGNRATARYRAGRGVTLTARSGNDLTRAFPEIVEAIRLDHDVVLDGEIVPLVLDAQGKPTGAIAPYMFESVQGRSSRTDAFGIRMMALKHPCAFASFDILELGERDLKPLPLTNRIDAHNSVMPRTARLNLQPTSWHDDGMALWESTKENHFEGIMAKRRDSTYQLKRSQDWLKIKLWKEGVFTVHGVTTGKRTEQGTFASLILGKDGKYVGCCGSGFDTETLQTLMVRLNNLKTEAATLSERVDDVQFWCLPFTKVEIRYLDYTSEGHLRIPSYRKVWHEYGHGK